MKSTPRKVPAKAKKAARASAHAPAEEKPATAPTPSKRNLPKMSFKEFDEKYGPPKAKLLSGTIMDLLDEERRRR